MTDTGSFNERGELEISKGMIVVCQGKKRSGKSVLATFIFRSFPGDKVVIDVAGDDGPMGDDVVTLTGTVDDLPTKWPESLRPREGQPMILRYVPDAGSPTFLADMDRIVGMAYAHSTKDKPVCLLVHEMGVLARVHQTPPHTRRVLMHNRHQALTLIACMPRTKGVDALVIGQADLVYTFDLPNPNDRKLTAEIIGWDPYDFEHGMRQVGRHEYLGFDANRIKPSSDDEQDLRLVHYPPLPEPVAAQTMAWAKGKRDPA
jgi:hypothetical protein